MKIWFWNPRRLRFVLLAIPWIGIVVWSCQFALTPKGTIPAEAESDFRLMAEAWNTIQQNYVDRPAVKPRSMSYGAISGMVDSLGDTGHSRFLTPEGVKQEHDFAKGQLEGIGAEVRMKDKQLVIVAPMDGSPAQRAHLKPGDVILKVDGEDIRSLPVEQAVKRILGPPGTSVNLTIHKVDTGHTLDVRLIRARILIHSVTWHRIPGTAVAHLRIATFSKGMSKDLESALSSLQEQHLSGVILDLRNNPGGLLDEAVATASQFLERGNVLIEKSAAGVMTPTPVKAGGMAIGVPMVALVNGGTASAAEIVAGALRDQRRAIIVGEKTFGTGTVLNMFSLSDGSALLLATQEWLTPSGHAIWHRGISPDEVVPLAPGVIPLIPQAEKGMTPAQLQASGDKQLLRALDILTQAANK
jgi:carboxyl-terminal processing protease